MKLTYATYLKNTAGIIATTAIENRNTKIPKVIWIQYLFVGLAIFAIFFK